MALTNSVSGVFSSVTDAMSTDHDRIDVLYADVRVMVEDGELERAEHFFADVRTQLLQHIRIEETILLPMMAARLGFAGAPEILRREHELIVAALDRFLYPMLDRVLSTQQTRQVIASLRGPAR